MKTQKFFPRMYRMVQSHLILIVAVVSSFLCTSCQSEPDTIVQVDSKQYAPSLTATIAPTEWQATSGGAVQAEIPIAPLFLGVKDFIIVNLSVQAFMQTGNQWQALPLTDARSQVETTYTWDRSKATITMRSLSGAPLSISTPTTVRFITY